MSAQVYVNRQSAPSPANIKTGGYALRANRPYDHHPVPVARSTTRRPSNRCTTPTDIKCRGGMNVGHKCPTYESENNNRKPEIPPNCPLPLWGRAGVGFACIPRCSLTIDTD